MGEVVEGWVLSHMSVSGSGTQLRRSGAISNVSGSGRLVKQIWWCDTALALGTAQPPYSFKNECI